MRIAGFIALFTILLLSQPAAADTIYLKNGKILQGENVTVTDTKVEFLILGGRMAIDIKLVERIERNNTTSRDRSFLRNSISGTPFNPVTTSNRRSSGQHTAGNEGGEEEDMRAETLENLINLKLRLQRELRFAESQIQTLRSVIYAKAAINSDTEEERQRLNDFEQEKTELQNQLEELPQRARAAGLLPADIRQLEQASESSSGQSGNALSLSGQPAEPQQDPRDADVTFIEDEEADESRTSDVVLDETTDINRSK